MYIKKMIHPNFWVQHGCRKMSCPTPKKKPVFLLNLTPHTHNVFGNPSWVKYITINMLGTQVLGFVHFSVDKLDQIFFHKKTIRAEYTGYGILQMCGEKGRAQYFHRQKQRTKAERPDVNLVNIIRQHGS